LIIQPTSLAALTWAGAAAGTTAESWRIGVVFAARPLGLTDKGTMVLQIGAMTVETEAPSTQLPAQFQVRVLSLGSQPMLEVLSSQGAEPVVQRALRERLPQQNGLAPLLATVGALSQRAMLRQLPPELRPVLAQLEQAMPSPSDVTSGEGLREAISRSGLFLESSLVAPPVPGQAAPLLDNDWKAALLKLAATLDRQSPTRAAPSNSETAPPLMQRGLQAQSRALPPALAAMLAGDEGDVTALLGRLHTDVHAALARIEVTQLEASTVPAWMIEIPLHGEDGNDVLQLQLEYGAESADAPRAWTLGFALHLPALGPVQGELQLRDLRLSVRLWAERSDTTQRLENQFTALRHRLAACGLLLDQLSCQTGLPKAHGRHSAALLQATA
jgi:hypothetical protein